MELILVGIIVWMWVRLRAERARRRAAEEATLWSGPPITSGLVACEEGGYLYWLQEGRLVRSPYRGGRADFESAVQVDPLEIDDVDPATLMAILSGLERYGAEVERRGV